jgi:hypothetical protein
MTPTPTITETPTMTPTNTPPVLCVCYTLEWIQPSQPTWIGLTHFTYVNCSGAPVSGSTSEGFPVNICAQEYSYVILPYPNGDGSADVTIAVFDCC